MNDEGEMPLLLVSKDVRSSSHVNRHMLSRVVIPVEVASKHDRLPKGHIWWVEKAGNNFQLRAKLYVTEATVERELRSGLRRAVWHLDTIRSERITWPGTRKQGGKVGDSLGGVVLDNLGGIAFTSVPLRLDKELEKRRLSICESALGFDQAARTLRQLFAKTRSHTPAINVLNISLEAALHFVHAYFAREELVTIYGQDPYHLAAAVLAGHSQIPNDIDLSSVETDSSSLPETAEFIELDEEHLSYVEKRWSSELAGTVASHKLEVKTQRHQQILQLLARNVRSKGFRPTYNRYVDLRVEGSKHEVLFEVKTADQANFQEQVRTAIGQLLEYKYRFSKRSSGRKVKLAAVIEASASIERYEFARGLLSELGIAMILWMPNTSLFEGLAEVLE
jgi:hypothetical protein